MTPESVGGGGERRVFELFSATGHAPLTHAPGQSRQAMVIILGLDQWNVRDNIVKATSGIAGRVKPSMVRGRIANDDLSRQGISDRSAFKERAKAVYRLRKSIRDDTIGTVSPGNGVDKAKARARNVGVLETLRT